MELKEQKEGLFILQDGARYTGRIFGSGGQTMGEVIFSTGMAGYEELITDPAYAGQLVVMTYPLIGNSGVNLEDMESDKPRLAGLVVREKCDQPNNWRCEMELDGFLRQNGVLGIEGLDTRAVTRRIREKGSMPGLITARTEISPEELEECFRKFTPHKQPAGGKRYVTDGKNGHLAALDLGASRSALQEWTNRGVKLTVFPAGSSTADILTAAAEGVLVTGGPGNPLEMPGVVETVRELAGELPVLGLGLGALVTAQALGCRAERMTFGHHGGNYPVKSLETGRVYITSQNHLYGVGELTNEVELTYRNVNDGSVEGFRHKSLPVTGLLFTPETNSGPGDTGFVLDEFLRDARKRG